MAWQRGCGLAVHVATGARLCVALLFCPLAHAHAQAPVPYLRIETGVHTGAINRAAEDSTGRWLVTASDDKTARVWDLQTGRLVHILRAPIGDGHEGKLHAVAVSPDGTRIALGGFTGAYGSSSFPI